MLTFQEFLLEETEIANDEIYLANMAKSFGDKAWFLKHIPEDVTAIVDFGGGAGEFAEYCKKALKRPMDFIIIDNNSTFLSSA